MKNTYHILNGDTLKEQFPTDLKGEIIVARECLVDGDVKSSSMEELFLKRAKFLNSIAPEVSLEDYMRNSAGEFRKMQNIEEGSEVNLWFEDDLFCQVNFWFVCYLLNESNNNISVFLVRPGSPSQYSFAAFSSVELKKLYYRRSQLIKLEQLGDLWEAYRSDNTQMLLKIAENIQEDYPFILPAVEAHLQRPHRLHNILLHIIQEQQTPDFGAVFHEFCKREPIYGFGDLQVKRLYEEVLTGLE